MNVEARGQKRPRSPLVWFGGKSRLAAAIAALIPPHVNYCEVFCGAAHVFFAKAPSPCEILNDRNGELINFWRVLSTRPDDLHARCDYAVHSRVLFDFYKNLAAGELAAMTPEERAWRFFYINRCCFAGRMDSPTYAVDMSGGKPMPERWPARLANAAMRLRHAHIENLDWRQCLPRYDRPETFFYLDPPYMGHEKDYGKNMFRRSDYRDLAAMLAGLKGKFLLSVNDTPAARQIFRSFNILRQGRVIYSVNRESVCRKGELLISNYGAGASSRNEAIAAGAAE